MKERQVICINKTDRTSPHERIRAIGGIYSGIRWKLTTDEAIRAIKNGDRFYVVNRSGGKIDVDVKTSRAGYEYLTTKPDGETQDNLLALPECP